MPNTSPGPPWEYRTIPGAGPILATRCKDILVKVASGVTVVEQLVADTRDVHQRLFAGLTPEGYPGYAGNYRGSPSPGLADYGVGVGGDPLVGVHPARVQWHMARLSQEIVTALDRLDQLFRTTSLSDDDKRFRVAVVAASFFQTFLTIHPYANGNGHVARLCVVAIFAKFGFAASGWTLDNRPQPEREYFDALYRHRRGDWRPLVKFIFNRIGTSASGTSP